MRRGFGAEARLASRADYRRVFSVGRKLVARRLILWTVPAAQGRGARLGLSVGSKVGPAVTRSRLKRLARESFRLNRERLKDCDLLVYLRPGCRWAGRGEAEKDILEACRKADLLK